MCTLQSLPRLPSFFLTKAYLESDSLMLLLKNPDHHLDCTCRLFSAKTISQHVSGQQLALATFPDLATPNILVSLGMLAPTFQNTSFLAPISVAQWATFMGVAARQTTICT